MSGEVVVRSCETVCQEGSAGFGSLASSEVNCCDTDLCNGAFKPNNHQLPVAVGLLVGIAVAARLL